MFVEFWQNLPLQRRSFILLSVYFNRAASSHICLERCATAVVDVSLLLSLYYSILLLLISGKVKTSIVIYNENIAHEFTLVEAHMKLNLE